MPQVSQDGQGNYFLSDDGKTWTPAPLSQDKDGNKFYNDGSAWQPLGGAAAGGDAHPAAAAPRSSPSQPAAAPASPLGAMARDANSATAEGIRNTGQGVEKLFGSGGADPLSPESLMGRLQGAAQIPLGEMQYLTGPLAPLFTQTQEANQHGIGDPVEHATGSPWLGHAAANTMTGLEGLALGPPVRGAPMRSMPYEARPGMPPTARPLSGDIIPPGPNGPSGGGSAPPTIEGEFTSGDHPQLPYEGGSAPTALGSAAERRAFEAYYNRKPSFFDPNNPQGANDGLPSIAPGPPRTGSGVFGDMPTPTSESVDTGNAANENLPTPSRQFSVDGTKFKPTDTPREGSLESFMAGNQRNAHLEEPGFDTLYVRRGPRLIGGRKLETLDLPNIIASDDAPPTAFLKFAKRAIKQPVQAVYAENIMNPKLAEMLQRVGFVEDKTQQGPYKSYYKITGNKASSPSMDALVARANEIENTPGEWPDSLVQEHKDIIGKIGALNGYKPSPEGGSPFTFNSGIDPVRAFRQIFAPETLSAEARQAHGDIREQIGLGERDTAVVQDMLEAHQRRANMMTPQERYDFFRYMQNRSKGFPINDPTLQGMADVARNAFTDVENKMRALPSTSQMAFRDDYFPQMWKDPRAAQQFFGGTRQGSGGFTKGRTFDTIDEGTAAGLELKNTNPVEMVLDYVNNANRFVALNAVRDDAVQHGYIRYIQDPRRVPPEWVKINGRLGQKGTPGGMIQGYAPRDYAQIWNNFVSQGIHGEPWKNVYDAALHAKNSVQALEFGLSAYHAFTVAIKAPALELARAANALMAGRPLTAAKAAGNAVIAPVSLVRTGMKARDVALGRITGTPIERQVVENLTRGNHRWAGLDKGGEYDYSPMRNYWTSFRRGALKGEVMHDIQGVADSWGLKAPQMILRHVGRMFQTLAAPLFEKYIPLLKNGAAYKQMHTWMESHPTASRAEILQASREIGDQIDNMMGEMVHDNVMWPKIQKQLAQLSLTSFSWTFGNARWLAGGLADLGKVFSRGEMPLRAATLITYPIVLGTIAAIAQKLMTGSFPDGSDPRDFLTPRTGGTTTYGSGRHTKIVPERLMIPGSHKDVMGYYHNFGQELWNKAARFLHMGAELATNQDWQGKNITTPGQDWTNPQWLKDYFDHVFQEMQPISVQQAGSGKPGSHITPAMRMLGFREPGRWVQDPEGAAQTQRYFDMKHEPAGRVQRLPHGRLRVLSPSEQDTRRQYKGPTE